MAWINLIPGNSGGSGRQTSPPHAKLYETGQLALSHSASLLLGHPPKITVKYDPDAQEIEIKPTTPNDRGGFTLSGGANTPYRFQSSIWVRNHPQIIGEYTVKKIKGGILLLRPKNEDKYDWSKD